MIALITSVVCRHKMINLSLHFHLNWYASSPRISLGSAPAWAHAHVTSKTFLGKGEPGARNPAREEIASLLRASEYPKGLVKPPDKAQKSSG